MENYLSFSLSSSSLFHPCSLSFPLCLLYTLFLFLLDRAEIFEQNHEALGAVCVVEQITYLTRCEV